MANYGLCLSKAKKTVEFQNKVYKGEFNTNKDIVRSEPRKRNNVKCKVGRQKNVKNVIDNRSNMRKAYIKDMLSKRSN